MCLPSTLSDDRIDAWRKRFGIMANLEVKIPLSGERGQAPPEGYITISEGCLKAGFRVPPAEEAVEIFKFCGVPITQFSAVGMTRIMGLVSLFREHGSRVTVQLFRDWCEVYPGPGDRIEVRSNKKWLVFEEKTDYHHGGTLFGFIKNPWGLPEVWRALPIRCRRLSGWEDDYSPVLGFEDVRDMAKALYRISAFVDEKRLILAGLSTDVKRRCVIPFEWGRKRKFVFTLKHGGVGSSSAPHEPVTAIEGGGSGDLEGGALLPDPGAGEIPKLPAIEPLPYDRQEPTSSVAKGKKRASSSLQPVTSKIGELRSITLAWNNHYVALKDEFESLQERLSSTEDSLTSARKRRETVVSRLDRSESELATTRAENETLRGEVEKVVAAREEAFNLLAVAQAEMSTLEVVASQLKDEVARLVSAQPNIEAIKEAAIVEYKESIAFMVECTRISEEARAEIMTTEVDQLLKDECETTFRLGFGKGLRLARRMPERSVAELGVEDASEDDDPDVDIEG